MLTPQVEAVTYRIIKERLIKTLDVFVHEIGGTDTHVHLAASIPPTLTISIFVGQLKGASSHDVNQHFAMRGKVLELQAGYGAVSFGTKDLPWVKKYVQNQRSHHMTGKIFDRLEQIAETETVVLDGNPVNGVDTVKEPEKGSSRFG